MPKRLKDIAKQGLYVFLVEWIFGGFLLGCVIGLLILLVVRFETGSWRFHMVLLSGIAVAIAAPIIGIASVLIDQIFNLTGGKNRKPDNHRTRE